MTLDGMTRLRTLVQARVDEEGQAQFAERIRVGIGVVRSLLNGRDIKASNLQTLCGAVGLDVVVRDHAEALTPQLPSTGSGYVIVPHLGAQFSAGPGRIAESEVVEGGTAFAREWFTREGVSPENAVMVRANGDSMVPTILDGAWVLVDRSVREVVQKGIYCLRRGEELFVKRILPSGKKADGRPSALVIVGDNPTMEPEVLTGPDLSDLVVIGRVFASLTVLS